MPSGLVRCPLHVSIEPVGTMLCAMEQADQGEDITEGQKKYYGIYYGNITEHYVYYGVLLRILRRFLNTFICRGLSKISVRFRP